VLDVQQICLYPSEHSHLLLTGLATNLARDSPKQTFNETYSQSIMPTTLKVFVQLTYTWCGGGTRKSRFTTTSSSSSSSNEQQWGRHRLSWRELSATKRHHATGRDHARPSSADNWLTCWYVTAIYTQMPSQSISLVAPQTTCPSFPHHPPPLCRRPGYLSRRIRYPLHRPTCIDTPPTRPPCSTPYARRPVTAPAWPCRRPSAPH